MFTLTVITPFLPTFFIAEDMSSPIFDSPFADIVPTQENISNEAKIDRNICKQFQQESNKSNTLKELTVQINES